MIDFDKVFSDIAKDMNTTAEDVKASIEEIARKGLSGEKISERHFWNQVPKKGDYPTAEEIVTFLSAVVYYGAGEIQSETDLI